MTTKAWVKRPDLIHRFPVDSLPRHMAIIMDGNGRWAKERGLPRALGHRAGVERLKSVIRLISDLGISALSLYAFSTENWQRPKDEVSALMGLLLEYMAKEIDELDENNVRIQTMGDLTALHGDVENAIKAAVDRTAGNTGLTVCFALNYGARQEIIRATRAIAQSVQEGLLLPDAITQDVISDALYTRLLPELDLIIRTSGEYRLSNFMLYQAAYAELLFTDAFWPDYDDEKLLESLHEYTIRNRRYGNV